MSHLSTEKEAEKKGAGVPVWMSGTAKVGSGLSSGGAHSPIASSLARLILSLQAPKAIVALTVAGGLALGAGVVSAIAEPEQPSLAQRFQSARAQTGAPTSSLPGMDGPRASALNMAQQANTGFYADPAAQAAAQAAADEAAMAEADAPADADSPEAAAQGGPADVEAQAAALAAAKGGKGLPSKFGKLSSGLAGGRATLTGGTGMAGGIGGTFKQPNLSNQRAGELRGAAGANRAQITRGKLASNNLGKSALKGATGKRLDKMSRAMRNSRATGVENQTAVHTQQWDSAQATGQGITGAGASGISGGQFSEEEGGGGGPLDQQSSAGSPNEVQNIKEGKNLTPYQNELNAAQGMLMLASAIITVIGALAMMGKAPIVGTAAAALQAVLFGVATALAAASAAIGFMLQSKYGQGNQGTIIGVAGSITTAFSIAAMVVPQHIPAWTAVLTGVAGMAAPMLGGAGEGKKLSDRSDISENG